MKYMILGITVLGSVSLTSCWPSHEMETSDTQVPDATRALNHASNIIMLSDIVTKHTTAQAAFDSITAKGLVVVDFYADWCGPCRSLGKTIQDIAPEFANITFLKVSIDTHKEVAQDVMSIPVLKFYKDGVEVYKTVGALGLGALRGLIKEKFSL